MMRKGFTLIELLVVIAIIAILAAILFPVFARARQSAMTTKCLVHGQELGKALMSYMDDYNGRFPTQASAEMMNPFSNVTWKWHPPWMPDDSQDNHGGGNDMRDVLLAKYVMNKDIWVCPSPESYYSMKYAKGWRCSWFFVSWTLSMSKMPPYPDTPFQRSTDDYGNPIVDEYGKPFNREVGRTLNEVLANDQSQWHRYTTPSKKVIAFCFALGDLVPIEAWGGSSIILNKNGSYPHNEGTIYVFADGHAKNIETGRGCMPVHYTDHILDTPHKRTK